MIRAALILLATFALPARAEVPIQEVTSPGGLTAWLVEEHSIPFVALELRFRGGSSLDEAGKRGATNLMTGLLEEGAGEMDALAFSQAKQDIAASIDFDVNDDLISVSARFLTETQDEASELVRLALNAPRFDKAALERVRGQVIAHLKSRETDPNALASTAFDLAAYGDHPYATYFAGSLDSVGALTRDDLITAWQNAIARDRVYIGAVGDITPEALGTLIDAILGGLPEAGAPLPEEVDFSAPPGVKVIDFDTPQSVAQFGHEGMETDDPDFFAAYLLNTIFGGQSFESRLYDEVREKRGLTYGIGSYLVDNDYSNAYLGSFSTVNARMGEALDVVREEWRKMAEDGVTEEELAAAKLYLTGSYPLRFDGNGRIAGILVGMQFDGYAIDYPATRNDRVNAVTLEQANRVASELFQPENLHVVVVGKPDGVAASLD